MVYIRSHLLDILRNNVAQVSFTKKNGENREMRCTLALEHLSAADHKAATESLIGEGNEYSDAAIRVFDLDKKEWRAFRVNSVYHVEAE